MFGVSKKIAASMAELLIILAIVGILSVLYRNVINEDAIAVKAGYRTILNNMVNFAATATDSYATPFGRRSVCPEMREMVNTIGEINCEFSIMPAVPNFTTTSGLRFFGLEQIFQNFDRFGNPSIFISVDIDGLTGPNEFERDIFPFELTQEGRIRPSGSPIRNEDGALSARGNVARDAELYAINLSFVPAGAQNRDDFRVIGNRISYSEAQCLGGNPFPYRESNPPHSIQMCIEDADTRTAINAFNVALTAGDREDAQDDLGDLNEDDEINEEDRDEHIRRYRRTLALNGANNIICSGLYTNANSVAVGLTPINADGIRRCGYCYKIAYIQDYCATDEQIWINPQADAPDRTKRRDAEGDEICPDAIINAEITANADGVEDEDGNVDRLLKNAMCSMPQWVELISEGQNNI